MILSLPSIQSRFSRGAIKISEKWRNRAVTAALGGQFRDIVLDIHESRATGAYTINTPGGKADTIGGVSDKYLPGIGHPNSPDYAILVVIIPANVTTLQEIHGNRDSQIIKVHETLIWDNGVLVYFRYCGSSDYTVCSTPVSTPLVIGRPTTALFWSQGRTIGIYTDNCGDGTNTNISDFNSWNTTQSNYWFTVCTYGSWYYPCISSLALRVILKGPFTEQEKRSLVANPYQIFEQESSRIFFDPSVFSSPVTTRPMVMCII